ncbi:MAG: haloacid dehalogenase-like hydrolase, partial [Bacteroidales bacterium]|nr:haloacid dehalogenase-like hydrolase [Bacteroidales bacterium]
MEEREKLPIVALIYDFDGTLSPGNMQEYSFIGAIGKEKDEFWAETAVMAQNQDSDNVLVYMLLMLEKAKEMGLSIREESFRNYGKSVELFEGVKEWFKRINDFGLEHGVKVEHYINSSGTKEIIEGTSIADEFKAIFACSFCYGDDGQALWPATAVNYTAKTQYLFRINKGILDITNDFDLNKFTPEDRRPIPFRNMIYIGDGLTDVPSMKMTRAKGGCSIAVHAPGDTRIVDDMLVQNRADFAIEADYSPGSQMEQTVQALLHQIRSVDD